MSLLLQSVMCKALLGTGLKPFLKNEEFTWPTPFSIAHPPAHQFAGISRARLWPLLTQALVWSYLNLRRNVSKRALYVAFCGFYWL